MVSFVILLARISDAINQYSTRLIQVQRDRIAMLDRLYEFNVIDEEQYGESVGGREPSRWTSAISEVWLQSLISVFGIPVAEVAGKMMSKEVRIPIRDHRDMAPAKTRCSRNAQCVEGVGHIPVVGG